MRNGHWIRAPWEKSHQLQGARFKLEDLTDWLLEKNREWSILSLQQRCDEIHRLQGVQVSRPCLSQFYKRQGISYTVAPYKIGSRYPDEHLTMLQYQFTIKVSLLLH